MIMTPARHYAEAQRALGAVTSTMIDPDDRARIECARLNCLSAIAHALLATINPQVYVDAAKYWLPPEDAA